jgi:hypothetical protein
MVRLWENEFKVRKTKHVRALDSDIIIIQRDAIPQKNSLVPNRQAKNGLYYIVVDFDALEPGDGKLSNYIRDHQDELKPIVEYTLEEFLDLYIWDAMGTSETLAISYVLEKDPVFSLAKLVALTSLSGGFADCDIIDDIAFVISIEMISPPSIPGRVYTLYSTVDGLDGGKH